MAIFSDNVTAVLCNTEIKYKYENRKKCTLHDPIHRNTVNNNVYQVIQFMSSTMWTFCIFSFFADNTKPVWILLKSHIPGYRQSRRHHSQHILIRGLNRNQISRELLPWRDFESFVVCSIRLFFIWGWRMSAGFPASSFKFKFIRQCCGPV